MPAPQINVTIGTAGHIDHGKTALVKNLTGCDTDRLKEEKERGMSIDLGYAPCAVGDIEVGIVDVPGHENFIKTMVAGASGMDAVLLVVAADDGVMPQTREHLDILTLLGVRHGLVALTKIDRVAPEDRELARSDIEQFLKGTFLEGKTIAPVSNVTGEGFDALYEALAALVRDVPPKSIDGVFRLPLDRAFAVQGYGTVVSGIPLCGSARLDDEVVLLPQGVAGTIRGIEVYGRTSEVVKAGQCAALNVRGFDHRAISRGDTLTVPGYFEPRQWFACALRLLPHDRLLVKHGSNVKFHTGTTEAYASVYAVKEGQMRSGEEHLVQIRTSSPVVAGLGDRFILRTPSPVRTVGGGVIIEALAGKLKRNRPGVYEDMRERAEAVGDESRLVEYFAKTASREADLAVRAKLPLARLQLLLRDLMQRQRVLSLGPKLYMHRDTCDQTARRVLELVGEYHRQSPESPGITIEQLRLDARMANDVLDGVISLLKTDGRLVEQKGRLAASEHRPTFRDEDLRRLEAVESLFRRQAFHPPTMEELVERTGACAADLQRVLKILREHQELIQVEEGLLFHREAVDRAREILAGFIRQEGKLESVRFKYLLDTTRKFALPLLDYFDRVGVTRRVGNTRYLKN